MFILLDSALNKNELEYDIYIQVRIFELFENDRNVSQVNHV